MLSFLLGMSIALAFVGEGLAQEVGVVFDPATLDTSADLPSGGSLTAYVVSFGVREGLSAYSFSLTTTSPLALTSSSCPSGIGCTNFGADDNFLVSLSSCYLEADPTLLGTFEILVPAGISDGLVCLGPYMPSGFPPFPEVVLCDGSPNQFLPYALSDPHGYYPQGCAVVNPTMTPPVQGESQRWSWLKSRF